MCSRRLARLLFHEANRVTGLEGDFNRKGTSAFAGRVVERVAIGAVCTIVDDGTLARRRGSLNIDDEGTPPSAHTSSRMACSRLSSDKMNARLTGTASTAMAGANPSPTSPAAHDQHLHAPRKTTARRNHRLGRGINAVNFRRRPGDITSGKFVSRPAGLSHRERQDGWCAHQGPRDWQRPRCAHARIHGGQRSS